MCISHKSVVYGGGSMLGMHETPGKHEISENIPTIINHMLHCLPLPTSISFEIHPRAPQIIK